MQNKTSEEKERLILVMKITKLKNINSFVYEGKDRNSAIKPIN